MLRPEEVEQEQIQDLAYKLLTGQFSAALVPQSGNLGERLRNPNQHWVALAIKNGRPQSVCRIFGLPLPHYCYQFQDSPDLLIGGIAPISRFAAANLTVEPLRIVKPNQNLVEVGVGRAVGSLEQIQQSWYQALLALGLASEVGSGKVSYFDNLGAYKLLANMDLEELKAYRDQFLKELLDHPHHGQPYFETLRAFLISRNVLGVARLQTYHRNTVISRIDRISELTGIKIDGYQADHEQLFDLEMAVKARTLIPVMENALRLSGL